MEDFHQIFKSSKARDMGVRLKNSIESHLQGIEENILGGAKVKLALYTRNDKNNVLCGIQEGSNDSCMLYVHHIEEIHHERLKFSGKGKHAKRIKFSDMIEIHEEDVKWLLSKVNENAPF